VWEYLGAVHWDAKGPLTLQLQDRKQQRLQLLRVDPQTGATSELRTLTDSAWVNLTPTQPRWKSAQEYLWVEETATGAELRLRAESGVDQLLLADQDIDILRVTEQGYAVHVRTPGESETILLGKFDGSKPIALPRTGMQSAVLSKNLDLAAITTTDRDYLPRTRIVRLPSAEVLAELPSVAADPGFRPNVQIEMLAGFRTAIVRPQQFVAGTKYPVIVDVYGGPHHIHVPMAMRNWLIPQWIADQGFLVVAVDNRGTPGRGRDWERAIYQKFDTVPLDDQIAGLQALAAKHPEMDLSRVGMTGWSFGGYMSASAVLRRPDVFHAAVAGAPVTDWYDYDTHYTERYLGVPPEDQAAYQAGGLISLAGNLRRPLLLVHGTADDNVYLRHSLQLADALHRAGKPFDFLPLPGITHMISSDPVVFTHYWERSIRFFQDALRRAP
jgi:dipeptidyl-peptidase-4